MSRVNTVNWSTLAVTNRFISRLSQAMIEYAPYSGSERICEGTLGKGKLGGDSDVLIAMIELRNYLNKCIEESPN